jgi:6-phosphogluconate dehydrogenase
MSNRSSIAVALVALLLGGPAAAGPARSPAGAARAARPATTRPAPVRAHAGPAVYRPRHPRAVAVIGHGGNDVEIARRLALGGHAVAPQGRGDLAGTIDRLAAKPGERTVWLTAPVDDHVIALLADELAPGDIVIDSSDGGDVATAEARAKRLAAKGVALLDVGVSGRVDGLERGFGLAIGGDRAAVRRATPLFQSVAPGARRGWAHIRDERGAGVIGGGKLVRTVEGAVDNAFRVALREGLDVLSKGKVMVDPQRALDAWQVGSILTSELVGATLDLVSSGGGYQSITERDVAPGKATQLGAIESGMPSLTLSSALHEQLRSPKVTPEARSPRAAQRAGAGRAALDREVPTVYRPRRSVSVGVVGLGRIGSGVARRMLLGGHQVVGFNKSNDGRAEVKAGGGTITESLEQLVAALPTVPGQPRAVFIYLPAGEITESTIARLADLLAPGDIIVDGGNSEFTRSIATGEKLKRKGIELVDVGTSGGIFGFQNGYSMMVGGSNKAVEHLTPVFQSLAPGARTGWAHMRDAAGAGIPGGGHFTKMVHNAIEYAWMSAMAEGLDHLAYGPAKIDRRTALKVWDERGPLSSLITAITRRQLDGDPTFRKYGALTNEVPDTGEGRATLRYATESEIPTQVLNAGLQQRFYSQALLNDRTDLGRVQAQQRRGFGGHKAVLAPAATPTSAPAATPAR